MEQKKLEKIAQEIQEYFTSEGYELSDRERKEELTKKYSLTSKEYSEILDIIDYRG